MYICNFYFWHSSSLPVSKPPSSACRPNLSPHPQKNSGYGPDLPPALMLSPSLQQSSYSPPTAMSSKSQVYSVHSPTHCGQKAQQQSQANCASSSTAFFTTPFITTLLLHLQIAGSTLASFVAALASSSPSASSQFSKPQADCCSTPLSASPPLVPLPSQALARGLLLAEGLCCTLPTLPLLPSFLPRHCTSPIFILLPVTLLFAF